MTVIESILERARWAPSGDNSQPWRFEILSDTQVAVHAFDTRHHCVYDIDGEASQLAVGALLETMRICATAHGRRMRSARRPDAPDEHPVIDVWFDADPAVARDPLDEAVTLRSVQRRPLSTRPLTADEKAALEASLGPDHTVRWFERPADRRRWAWLAAQNAKIRLTIPEAYAVHREIIEWGRQFSEARVPDQALGASKPTLVLMRWAMAKWERIAWMNRFLGGTVAPRIEMDLLPGLLCAAHFAIVARSKPATIDDRLVAGAAVQRFWLTATRANLQLQPQHTPLVFAQYARARRPFTAVAAARARADAVAQALDRLLGPDAERAVFLGRLGAGAPAASRSTRLPLASLRWMPAAAEPDLPSDLPPLHRRKAGFT
jgi:nitroreductase